ncbi:MAG: gliding motility-associated C-terminal domain-containing protein [Bacteroidota bacterium]|nr:MAG: gliding motility-associated C-terminal domain-containing protein [Bacteroidota bacterium]
MMRMRTFHIIFLLFIALLLQAQADFTSTNPEGCIPLEVDFAIDSSTYDLSTITAVSWDFGNGTVINAGAYDTVTAIYNDVRRYSVSLTINNNSAGTVARSGYINALGPLNSDFRIVKEKEEPDYTYSFHPLVEMTDNGANYTFAWEHFEGATSLRRIAYSANYTNPENAIEQYTYPDTGNYRVELLVRMIQSTYICESLTSKDLPVFEEFEVGNVFSPGTTDYFVVDPENVAVVLSFTLFSRAGIEVFEQEAPIIYWDGKDASGRDLSAGVYFYTIEALQGDTAGFYSKKGFIHLFR